MIEPNTALQVTSESDVFVTVAKSCTDLPLVSAAVAGFTVTVIAGRSVIVVEEEALVSTWLVAVTVTVCN